MQHKLLSPKLVQFNSGFSGPRLAHYCPACAEVHPFAVKEPQRNGAIWTYNGNAESPTFNPSMNITVGRPADPDFPMQRCHYFLRDGRIQYLDDCTHELRGQTVALPDIPVHVLRGHGISVEEGPGA